MTQDTEVVEQDAAAGDNDSAADGHEGGERAGTEEVHGPVEHGVLVFNHCVGSEHQKNEGATMRLPSTRPADTLQDLGARSLGVSDGRCKPYREER